MLSLFGEMELAGLDAAVPPDVVLRLPSRPAGAIPQPPARPRGLGTWATVIVIPVLLVAADIRALAVSNTLAVGDLDPFGRPITVGSVVALWAVALALTGSDAGLIWGIARRIRWARRQRKLTT